MHSTFAQDSLNVTKNTVVSDTAKTIKTISFSPSPTKAVLYAALVPGLGQIYNKKYWKLPFVYAGYAALVYAISWNGSYYKKYKKAYVSIADDNTSTNDYLNYIPSGQDPSTVDENWLEEVLRLKQLGYRSNRDLAIISIIGFYGITLIDAYVDAQLYDFDISPDLTMRIEPVLNTFTDLNSATLGLRCQLTF